MLDAGCGLGTESLFWASLRPDITVLGIDISPERLDAARARLGYYQHRLDRPLQVRFQDRDVFRVLDEERFDFIWTMEAISHIDPAEKFVQACASGLENGGYLAISDSHLVNPYMAWRIILLRSRDVKERTQKRTSDGTAVSYAQERLFSAGRLSGILHAAGFSGVRSQLSVFLPPALANSPTLFPWYVLLDRLLNRIPILRNLGAIFTITASLPGTQGKG
jgi:SAM-dependent methyltransferase